RPRVQQQDLLGPFTKVSARLTVLEEGEHGAADAAVAAHDENAIRAPGSRTHVPTSVRRRPPSPIVSNITDSLGSSTVPVPCAGTVPGKVCSRPCGGNACRLAPDLRNGQAQCMRRHS